jgi:hypothetical protein
MSPTLGTSAESGTVEASNGFAKKGNKIAIAKQSQNNRHSIDNSPDMPHPAPHGCIPNCWHVRLFARE